MSWRSASERRAHASSVGRATSSTPRRAASTTTASSMGSAPSTPVPTMSRRHAQGIGSREAERRALAVAIAERSRLLLVAPADAPPARRRRRGHKRCPSISTRPNSMRARFHRCPLLIAAVRGPSVRGSRRLVKVPWARGARSVPALAVSRLRRTFRHERHTDGVHSRGSGCVVGHHGNMVWNGEQQHRSSSASILALQNSR